jgi:hypothetical protein
MSTEATTTQNSLTGKHVNVGMMTSGGKSAGLVGVYGWLVGLDAAFR